VALIGGLALFNITFLIYLIVLLVTKDKESEIIEVELFCWIVGTISTTILLSAIIYTLVKLRKMWTGQDNAEVKRIRYIAVFFGLAFVTRTVYEWAEYIEY
jgi:heme/copper-type cytochrome/quinol oxidase subunit 3